MQLSANVSPKAIHIHIYYMLKYHYKLPIFVRMTVISSKIIPIAKIMKLVYVLKKYR